MALRMLTSLFFIEFLGARSLGSLLVNRPTDAVAVFAALRERES